MAVLGEGSCLLLLPPHYKALAIDCAAQRDMGELCSVKYTFTFLLSGLHVSQAVVWVLLAGCLDNHMLALGMQITGCTLCKDA